MEIMSQKIEKFAAATNNELFDGGWMIEAVETAETIDDFIESSKSYAECSTPKRGSIAGFQFVAFSKIQPQKGARRRQLSVIDFGEYRYALDTDLTNF